jgi:hypothetical protein
MRGGRLRGCSERSTPSESSIAEGGRRGKPAADRDGAGARGPGTKLPSPSQGAPSVRPHPMCPKGGKGHSLISSLQRRGSLLAEEPKFETRDRICKLYGWPHTFAATAMRPDLQTRWQKSKPAHRRLGTPGTRSLDSVAQIPPFVW